MLLGLFGHPLIPTPHLNEIQDPSHAQAVQPTGMAHARLFADARYEARLHELTHEELVPLAAEHCGAMPEIDALVGKSQHNVLCALQGPDQEALWRVASRCVDWPYEKVVAASRRRCSC